MNWKKTLSVTIVAMSFLAAANALAKAKDSRNVLLPYGATVAGSHLASGSYNVKWQTHSPQATVSFSQGNKVVATAEGKVVDRGSKYPSNEVVYNESTDGTRLIQEIRFGGSSEVIEFNQ